MTTARSLCILALLRLAMPPINFYPSRRSSPVLPRRAFRTLPRRTSPPWRGTLPCSSLLLWPRKASPCLELLPKSLLRQLLPRPPLPSRRRFRSSLLLPSPPRPRLSPRRQSLLRTLPSLRLSSPHRPLSQLLAPRSRYRRNRLPPRPSQPLLPRLPRTRWRPSLKRLILPGRRPGALRKSVCRPGE
jgi:hypothetical protein